MRYIESNYDLNDSKYIYANSKEEAKEIYKQKYVESEASYLLNGWHWIYCKKYIIKNIENSTDTKLLDSTTISILQEKMDVEDFLEYCRDRLYPIEKAIRMCRCD